MYNSQTLVRHTKKELFKMLQDEAQRFDSPFEEITEDEEYEALSNIEQITYVLRNCAYEGKE